MAHASRTTRHDPHDRRDQHEATVDDAGPPRSADRSPGAVVPAGPDAPFERVAGRQLGYHARQVDEFMARARTAYERGEGLTAHEVRHTVFDAVRGGYLAEQVDEVLDRLEDTLARVEREELIRSRGQGAWTDQRSVSLRELMGRLERPDGERFRRPWREAATGYATEDVDRLCDRLLDHLGGSGPAVSADDVRRAAFEGAVGAEGYDEAQVDAFCDAAVEYLSVQD